MGARQLMLGAFLAGGALLAACGGSDDGTSEDALKERVKESAEAIFQGEAREAYETFSEECQEEVSMSEFRSTLEVAAAFFEGFADMKLEDLEVTEVKIRNFEDDSAEAAIVVEAKDGNEAAEEFLGDEDEYSRWEVEDGQWVLADCSDLGFDSGDDAADDDSDDAAATPTRTTATVRTPTAAPTSAVRPKLGETAQLELAKYTVNAVQDNVAGTEFFKPKAGMRWIAFDVTIEAVKETTYNPFDFSVQDADAFVYDPAFVPVDSPSPDLSSGDLAVGERIRGWVFFEVPLNAKLNSVRVTPDFGKPATVIADLTK